MTLRVVPFTATTRRDHDTMKVYGQPANRRMLRAAYATIASTGTMTAAKDEPEVEQEEDMDGWEKATTELTKLLRQKQEDYGPGNITAFGHLGVHVPEDIRLSDKLERLKNLIHSARIWTYGGGTSTPSRMSSKTPTTSP